MNKLVYALAAVCCMALVTAVAYAEDPSFKTGKDKDSKEFAAKVFEAIVKGVRSKPADVKFEKHEIKSPKAKDTEIKLVGTYKGLVSRKVFNVTIKLKVDTSDEKEWTIKNLDYSDDNKVTGAPKQKDLDAIVTKLNR